MKHATRTALPPASSVTHLHLLAVANALLADRKPGQGPLRILDIGCGDGRLMSYLQQMAAHFAPRRTVEVYGFDVFEHGYGVAEEHRRALRALQRVAPEIDWSRRISAISVEDPWPYAEDFFDLALSNQVLEHVRDADHFLGSLKRVLKTEGASVHLFPMKNCIVEGHVKVPFAHRAYDHQLQQALIRWFNRIGIGRWRRDRTLFGHRNLDEYALSQAHYLSTSTFYRTFTEFHGICEEKGLSVSYHYTKDFYLAKLRSLAGRSPKLAYRARTRPVVEWLAFLLLRYAAAVTLVVEPLAYDTAARKHAEKRLLAELAKPSAGVEEAR